MSEPILPKTAKARFSVRLERAGNEYLCLTIWQGKKEPDAEVVAADIRQLEGDNWKTVGRLHVYRTADGTYRKLPEREPPSIP